MNRRDVLIDDWRMTHAGTLGEGFDLILAPAQRVDIIADVTATDQIAFIPPTRDCPFHSGKVPVAAEKSERQMSDMKTRVMIT